MQNRFLNCKEQGIVALNHASFPAPSAGEITVALSFCGICGTDVEKVFGAYPKPQKLGHEVVGRVAIVGEGVTHFRPGDRVALAHHLPDAASHYARRGSETMDPAFKRSNIDPGGFADVIRVPALHARETVVAIPDHVPDLRAVFMEPLACCLRALDRLDLAEGDSVMVVGVGAVGMLFVPLLAARGQTVLAVDARAERLTLAEQWGARAGGLAGEDDLVALARNHSNDRGVDAVLLTVVNAATITSALAGLRDGGTLVIFGGKPGLEAALPMWDLWTREINIITSYSATPAGLARAMALLSSPVFDGIEKLVSHSLPLAQAQEAFERVKSGKASKVVLYPNTPVT